MADQRLLDGGPWAFDDPGVTFDGYLEDFGAQDSTYTVGPTFDGVAHGLPPARTQGHGAQRITEWRSGEMTRTHNAP